MDTAIPMVEQGGVIEPPFKIRNDPPCTIYSEGEKSICGRYIIAMGEIEMGTILLEEEPIYNSHDNNNKQINKEILGLFPSTDSENLGVEKKLKEICKKFGFNESPEYDENKPTYLFKTASLFSHACDANCIWVISTFPDGKIRIRIRAACTIYQGERLGLNRLGDSIIFRGTWWRQQIYYDRFNQFCNCQLCTTANEIRTFQSGVICRNCLYKNVVFDDRNPHNFGYYLQLFPFVDILSARNDRNLKPEVVEKMGRDPMKEVWKCSRCHDIKIGDAFHPRINRVYKKIQSIEDALIKNPKESLAQAEKLDWWWKEELTEFLHPQHWLIQMAVSIYPIIPKHHQGRQGQASKASEVKVLNTDTTKNPKKSKAKPEKDINNKTEEQENKSQDDDEDLNINRLQYIITIMKKTCPGIQPQRVKYLLKLAFYIVDKYRDELDPLSLDTPESQSKEEAEQYRSLIQKHLQLAIQYLNDSRIYWKGHLGQAKEKVKILRQIDDYTREARKLMGLNDRQIAILTSSKLALIVGNYSETFISSLRMLTSVSNVLSNSFSSLMGFRRKRNNKAVEAPK